MGLQFKKCQLKFFIRRITKLLRIKNHVFSVVFTLGMPSMCQFSRKLRYDSNQTCWLSRTVNMTWKKLWNLKWPHWKWLPESLFGTYSSSFFELWNSLSKQGVWNRLFRHRKLVLTRISSKVRPGLYISPLNWDTVQKTLPKNNFQEGLRTNQHDVVYNTQELYRNQFHFL